MRNRPYTHKPSFRSKIYSLPWQEYVERVKRDVNHPFEGRLQILQNARAYFEDFDHFKNMPSDKRKKIAGVWIETTPVDWGWFGYMRASGEFTKRIIENTEHISTALDCIPLHGDVTSGMYYQYVERYQMSFAVVKNRLATATRLLAMKRPDVFFCLDSRNKEKLCGEFGIVKTRLSLETYWQEVIERIQGCLWWTAAEPVGNEVDRQIWRGRAAFLDALFYDP